MANSITAVQRNFTATNDAGDYLLLAAGQTYVAQVSGTYVGQLQLEIRFDDGTPTHILVLYTANGLVWDERTAFANCQVRLFAPTMTSGTAVGRIAPGARKSG